MATVKQPAGHWGPSWAKHVSGVWTEREVDEETGEVDPGIITIRCEICGGEERIACKTGNYRGWINKFASVHYHADPLAPDQVEKQRQAAVDARAKKRES